MTPDEINSLAFRAIVALLVIIGLIVGFAWALDNGPVEVLAARGTVQSTQPASEPESGLSVFTPSVLTTTTATAAAAEPAERPGRPAPTTSTNGQPVQTTQTDATTAPTTPTSPPTTPASPPSTTTTSPPLTTTSTTSSTTTLPSTTTTTTTTTTTPTTTLPPTTTTTSISLPGLFVQKFEGHDHGDPGVWEAHIKIEIRIEGGERAGPSSVLVAWDGPQAGSRLLEANKDGKIDERLGDFSGPSVTLTIIEVFLDGYVYQPELNAAPPSILVEGPA